MATRKSRNATRSRTSRTTAEIDPTQIQQAAQAGTQKQIVMAVDATSAMLRAAEIISRVQLRAIQRSNQTWREAAERLHAATGPVDVFTAQNQLVMNTVMQGMQFVQEMLQAGAVLQPETVTVEPEEGAEAATQPLAEMMQTPAMRAWQTMFTPAAAMNGAAANGAAA